ncbi:MAG: acyl-CoA dehydrogenase [Hyphomicrobiales bacterium]|nr:acyl-CoA dehydrogenase [Hyphomicrobiales bacterium]
MTHTDGFVSERPAEIFVRPSDGPHFKNGAPSDVVAQIRQNASKLDQSGEFPVADISAMASAGLLTRAAQLAFAMVKGQNKPASASEIQAILRSLGYANLSVARLFEGHFNALLLIARYGTRRQFAQAYDDATEGKFFAIWNAEAGNPLKIEELADGAVLNGAKCFCSGAAFVERALVTATEASAQKIMVLVELERDERCDLSSWKPLGMRASGSGGMDFSGIEISRLSLIGKPGDYFRQPDFSAGAWRFLAAQLGAIDALVECLRDDLVTAGRQHDPYQKARFAQALICIETAALWVKSAAMKAENDALCAEQRTSYVGLARHAVERAALDVIELVQKSIGLNCLLQPHPAERVMRDLATYLRQPAPDRVLSEAAAYALTKDSPLNGMWTAS